MKRTKLQGLGPVKIIKLFHMIKIWRDNGDCSSMTKCGWFSLMRQIWLSVEIAIEPKFWVFSLTFVIKTSIPHYKVVSIPFFFPSPSSFFSLPATLLPFGREYLTTSSSWLMYWVTASWHSPSPSSHADTSFTTKVFHGKLGHLKSTTIRQN